VRKSVKIPKCYTETVNRRQTDGRTNTLCNGQMKIDNWNNNSTQNTTRKAKD